jgi:O-antigen/teichoic acid export membrane protein
MTKQPSFKRAVRWAYAMSWGGKAFGALFAFFLAAILGPRDFGAVALAMVYIAFVDMILDQGLFAAIIQRKALKPEHLDAVFWLNIGVSLILIALTFVTSGWWARLNHLPELESVIRALSSIILLEALAKVQRAILQREMDFKSLAIRSNGSVVVGGIVGLTMAVKGYGVWALVGQRICEDSAALVLLWTVGHWRPRLRFSFDHLKDLLGFSLATFAIKIGDFAYSQADAASMGIFFGPVAVGLFRLAQKLVNLILDTATSSLQTVSFSEFSRLQDSPAELRRSVLKCLKLGSVATFPALAGLALSSRQVMAVLGDKWAPAAPALTVYCFFGISHALSKFTSPLLMARNRAHLMAILTWSVNGISVGTMIATAILLKDAPVQHQVLGIAAARLAVGVGLMAPVFLFFLLRFSQTRMGDLLHAVGPSVIAAGATALSVWTLNATAWLSGIRPVGQLAGDVMVGGAAGISALLASDREMMPWVRDLVGRLSRLISPGTEEGEYLAVEVATQSKGPLA